MCTIQFNSNHKQRNTITYHCRRQCSWISSEFASVCVCVFVFNLHFWAPQFTHNKCCAWRLHSLPLVFGLDLNSFSLHLADNSDSFYGMFHISIRNVNSTDFQWDLAVQCVSNIRMKSSVLMFDCKHDGFSRFPRSSFSIVYVLYSVEFDRIWFDGNFERNKLLRGHMIEMHVRCRIQRWNGCVASMTRVSN